MTTFEESNFRDKAQLIAMIQRVMSITALITSCLLLAHKSAATWVAFALFLLLSLIYLPRSIENVNSARQYKLLPHSDAEQLNSRVINLFTWVLVVIVVLATFGIMFKQINYILPLTAVIIAGLLIYLAFILEKKVLGLSALLPIISAALAVYCLISKDIGYREVLSISSAGITVGCLIYSIYLDISFRRSNREIQNKAKLKQ